MIQNKHIKISVRTFLSVCSAIAFNHYFKDSIQYSQTISLFICFLQFFLFDCFSQTEHRVKTYSIGFSFLLSCALIIGQYIDKYNAINEMFVSVSSIIEVVLSIVGFTVLLGSVISMLIGKINTINPLNKPLWKFFENKFSFYYVWLIIFVSWIPCYLSYFPGTFTYDLEYQTWQIMKNIPFDKHHPPLHTMIWGFCLYLEKYIPIENFALIFYEIVQMLVLSLTFAYVLKFFIKKNLNNYIILVSLIFFALCPNIPVFGLSTVKDVWCGMFFVLFTVTLIDLLSRNNISSRDLLKLFLFQIIFCLFRNNAIYGVILTIPFIIGVFYKRDKRIISSLLIGIICAYLINGPIYKIMGFENGQEKEALCVPMQQIANVVTTDYISLTENEKNEIREFFDFGRIAEQYNPRFADPVKDNFKNEAYVKDKGRFFILWLNLLLKYPDHYINAFLSLNMPYWYPDSLSPDFFNGRLYIETSSPHDVYPVEIHSKLPWLHEFYEKVASFELFTDKPIVSTFFSISTPIWLLLFTVTVLLVKKKYKLTVGILPALFFWLTYMAGPVSNFRYIFPIFICYPIYLALILQTDCFMVKK